MARRISSSRPITGSSLPMRARSVRSMQYFFKASRCPSASALLTLSPPRTAATAASKLLRVSPASLTVRPSSFLLSHKANKNNSLATKPSPRLMDSFSAACKSWPLAGASFCYCRSNSINQARINWLWNNVFRTKRNIF